ncbi:MAG: hypothetical protein DHS80DRAFT_29622 [Piptocephalis tieghemiana]|nr:MAG: hypothetical protein DHS80DRAFT_29622 [Piptocephalis tieghemiana]
MVFRIRRQGQNPRDARRREERVNPAVQRELFSLQTTLNSPGYQVHRQYLACLGTGVQDPPHSVIVTSIDAEGLVLQCRARDITRAGEEEECRLLYRQPAKTIQEVRYQLRELQEEAGRHMGQAGSLPTPAPFLAPLLPHGPMLLFMEIVLLLLLLFSQSYAEFASNLLSITGTIHFIEAIFTFFLCIYRGYEPLVILYYTLGVMPFGIFLLQPLYSISTATI